MKIATTKKKQNLTKKTGTSPAFINEVTYYKLAIRFKPAIAATRYASAIVG
jgi:hypothetical protein